MKLLEFKKEKEEFVKKELNKKKVIGTIIVIIMIIIIMIITSLYVTNIKVRDVIDLYILRKNVTESSLNSIEINEENNPSIFAYSNSLVVLEKNILTKYNSSGKKEGELKIEVNNPIFEMNDNYLIIAEKGKNKVYLVHNGSIVWEKDLEGNISKISVNKNGFTSIILTGTTYKSVIIVFDKTGKELFKTYLSSTIAIDSTISEDNKYLSFAEINTTGTIVQSTIKTVSIEKASKSPTDSIIATYNSEEDDLIINIKYQEKTRLACMYNNSIRLLQLDKDEMLINLNEKNKKYTFADVELNNYVYGVSEKSVGLFKSNSVVEIYNTSTKKQNIYNFNGVAKKIYSKDSIIAIDLGTEIHFIGMNGWLIKKYISSQEIKNIILADGLAGIVYRDRLEFITL